MSYREKERNIINNNMNKEQFIEQEIKKLKKIMYTNEPDLMTEDEEKKFKEFFNEFIKDLKEISKTIKNENKK